MCRGSGPTVSLISAILLDLDKTLSDRVAAMALGQTRPAATRRHSSQVVTGGYGRLH